MTPDLYPRTAMLDIIVDAMAWSGLVVDETSQRERALTALNDIIAVITEHQISAGWIPLVPVADGQ